MSEEEITTPEPKAAPPTTVQIVLRKSGLLLVEWENEGQPKRAWIVPEMIVEQVDAATALVQAPDEGVPYGEDWAALLEVNRVTPAAIDRELKRKGIWTLDDLRGNPSLVRKVLIGVYGLDVAAILSRAAQINGGTP